MILGKVNYKHLAIYGVLEMNSGYTVNKETSRVIINTEIAFNLSDIQQSLDNINQHVEELKSDEDIEQELREIYLAEHEEQLEILNLLKNKLS